MHAPLGQVGTGISSRLRWMDLKKRAGDARLTRGIGDEIGDEMRLFFFAFRSSKAVWLVENSLSLRITPVLQSKFVCHAFF